jgi:ribosomal protein S16
VKKVTIDLERTKYWLGVGAIPTEPVAKLLAKAGLLPPFPRTEAVPVREKKVPVHASVGGDEEEGGDDDDQEGIDVD